MKLKPCPCGETPELNDYMYGVKWRYVVTCCDNKIDILSSEGTKDVEDYLNDRIDAWNDAPRGGE